MQIYLILALAIAVLAVIFAVQNTDPVSVDFIIWQFNSSLALVMIISMLIGVLISILLSSPSMVKNSWTIRKLNKKLSDMEKALNEKTAELEEAQKDLIVKENELEQARQAATGQPEQPVPEIPQAEAAAENEPPTSDETPLS